MGKGCLSKPLCSILRRPFGFGVPIQPHSPPTNAGDHPSNYLSNVNGATSTIELSLIINHKTASPAPIPVESCKNGMSTKKSKNGMDGAKVCHSSSQGSSRKAKNSQGPRRSVCFGRMQSSASETSSMSGFMHGIYGLANMTAYESSLVPDIWKRCLSNNKYFCEHVLGRLLNKHPEMVQIFEKGQLGKSDPGDEAGSREIREIIISESSHLSNFFNRLINEHELDCDKLLEECEQLGRSYARHFHEFGLQPYHWDVLAHCMVQEYIKTQMHCDMNTDEKELQQLSWIHFATAVTAAVKEAFEDEINLTPAPNAL